MLHHQLDGPRRAACCILLVSLACIAALFLLTSESLGLKRLRLFPPNALRSHHHHHQQHQQHQQHQGSSAHPSWPSDDRIIREKADPGAYIEVVVPGDVGSLAGTVAVVNSVLQHTSQPVRFHLVVTSQAVTHLREWLKGIPGDRLLYEVIVFPEKLLRLANHDVSSAEVFLAEIIPTSVTGRVIFINNDAIVQGDIAELHGVAIKHSSYGAFLMDSQSASRHTDSSHQPVYSKQINMMNRYVRRRHVKGSRGTFSGGVFVAVLKYWRQTHAHRQLVAWLRINRRMSIVGPAPGATDRRAAMLLVFYGHVSALPPTWHVNGLGVHEKAPFSESFARDSKLIRWSGHLKPWTSHAPFRHLWTKFEIPDPLKGRHP